MPTSLKILVVGPQRTGKTLLCKLLADQPFGWDPQRASYHPTQILRIQEVVRLLPLDKCNVQLWDCSGDHQHAQHWPVLSKGLDGLLMLYDPANPGHEEELQKFYIHLAQPHRLSKKQCMILGLSVSEPPPGNAGLQGKLRALSHNFVDLSSNPQAGVKAENPLFASVPESPVPECQPAMLEKQGLRGTAVQEARAHIDNLLAGCLSKKQEAMEQAVMAAA